MAQSAREKTWDVIFGHETRAGKSFDLALIIVIFLSVLVVMLDSVTSISLRWGETLHLVEWIVTVLFTIEYLLRVWCARDRRRYVTSFFGIVDLLSILPTYLSILVPGSRFLVTFRILRVLRVFRVLKLAQFIGEAAVLRSAVRASRHKIVVFIFTVLTIVVIVGSLMYLVEGPASGFTSIPQGVYWAVVTLTTVGYGDIAPVTPFGRFLAAALMILGYGIIAVPTGIVTVELDRASRRQAADLRCTSCGLTDHDGGSRYCRDCGSPLARGESASLAI